MRLFVTQSRRPSLPTFLVWLGVAFSSFVACGDKTVLPPRSGSGGGTTVGAPGTGGASVGTGGANPGAGGASVGTGGASLGTGGASLGTGGASLGTGGASSGTGGTSFGAGGASPGTLARGGAGGAGGAVASGGTGGGIVAGCQYPSCLWNLVKDCLVTGPCTQDTGSTSNLSTLCCSNGVTEVVSVRTQPSGAISGTVIVTKHGEACYSVTFNGATGSGATSVAYGWFDPSGQLAVRGELSGAEVVTLTCPDGESVEFSTDCEPDGSDGATKTNGTCR